VPKECLRGTHRNALAFSAAFGEGEDWVSGRRGGVKERDRQSPRENRGSQKRGVGGGSGGFLPSYFEWNKRDFDGYSRQMAMARARSLGLSQEERVGRRQGRSRSEERGRSIKEKFAWATRRKGESKKKRSESMEKSGSTSEEPSSPLGRTERK